MRNSEEADTRVNSEEVLSDEDFPAVFGARDIRQVIRGVVGAGTSKKGGVLGAGTAPKKGVLGAGTT